MLNKRLETILSLCDKQDRIADVGCDHAFLAIELINNNIAKHVYASDIAMGPLNIAKNNVKNAKLENRIDCILSDGLKNVPDDANAIVIAGMGYHTACKILTDQYKRLDKFSYIIVQINSDVPLFREWLSDHHATIIDERIVFDHKYYTIIKFNMDHHEEYSLEQIIFGPILLLNKDQVFKEYYQKELAKYQFIYQKITNDDKRKKEVLEMMEMIQKVLQ